MQPEDIIKAQNPVWSKLMMKNNVNKPRKKEKRLTIEAPIIDW